MLNEGHKIPQIWNHALEFLLELLLDEGNAWLRSDVKIYTLETQHVPPPKETISIGNESFSNHWFSGEVDLEKTDVFKLLPIFSSLNHGGQFWQIIHLNTLTMRFKDVLVFFFLFLALSFLGRNDSQCLWTLFFNWVVQAGYLLESKPGGSILDC